MEIYFIPFQQQFIIYRPLRRLAFIGNDAFVKYITCRLQAANSVPNDEIEAFLAPLGFWEPDPPPPPAWIPISNHHPTMAVLLMTNACNLRCIYCYAHGGEGSRRQMTKELASRAIDVAAENAAAKGLKSFSLAFHGGGEPTLNWPVLKYAVEFSRSKDLPCDITMASNGVWNQDQSKFIIEHFNALSLSFDGIPEIQNKQRPRANGGSSFPAVMKTIAALDDAGLPYGIRMTATELSFRSLGDSVDFICQNTQCSIIQIEPCYTLARGLYQDPTPTQAEVFIQSFFEAFEVASQAGRTLFYSGARPWIIASKFCKAPEEALVVTPEGDLVACFEIYSHRHPQAKHFLLGRMTQTDVQLDLQSIEKVVASQETRRQACQGCHCYWHCGGDCSSRCANARGVNQNRCTVNREITKELLAWYISAGEGVWRG